MTRSYERMGKPTMPEWWTEIFEEKLAAAEMNQAELAEKASAKVGRESPWTSSAISKFKSGDAVTWELAIGISFALDFPPPIFVADSLKEASEMQSVARRFDSSRVTPDQNEKALRIEQALDASVKESRDQTKPVRSSDERSPRGRGHRRASRGG